MKIIITLEKDDRAYFKRREDWESADWIEHFKSRSEDTLAKNGWKVKEIKAE